MNKLKLKRTRQEKGITLIALIITIVVLLILAVVAIRAVTGDGILQHAKNAQTKYEAAQASEQTMLQEYLNEINGNVPGGNNNEEIDLLEKYILGAEKTGRNLSEITNPETMTFINEDTTIKDASTTISILFLTNGNDVADAKMLLYIKYNDNAYKILCDGTTGNTEKLEWMYTPQGREGTTVQYDSNGDDTPEDWVIITDRDGKVEIVSKDVMYDKDGNALTLGRKDTRVTVTTDLDGDETIGDEEDISIASYNNAIATINKFCDEIVTATDNDGVRSVGGNKDTAGLYSSEKFNSLYKGIAGLKTYDTNYEQDFVRMSYWGVNNSENDYWVASRIIESDDGLGNANFFVRAVLADSDFPFDVLDGYGIVRVDSEGVVEWGEFSAGVRPVIINPSGI